MPRTETEIGEKRARNAALLHSLFTHSFTPPSLPPLSSTNRNRNDAVRILAAYETTKYKLQQTHTHAVPFKSAFMLMQRVVLARRCKRRCKEAMQRERRWQRAQRRPAEGTILGETAVSSRDKRSGRTANRAESEHRQRNQHSEPTIALAHNNETLKAASLAAATSLAVATSLAAANVRAGTMLGETNECRSPGTRCDRET